MNQIGAVRRIDELGRIVIPKGIRNRLRINEGDRLEIAISETGKIEMQKYNAFVGNYDMITNIVFTLAKELHHPAIIICDGKILTKSDNVPDEIHEGIPIEKNINDRLYERKNFSLTDETILPYGEHHSFSVFPIAYNSEILGGLLILHENPLNEDNIKMIQAFRNLLTMILKV